MDTTATGTGRLAARRGMWVLLLWVGVAGIMLLTGCVDALSFADDPTRDQPAPDGASARGPHDGEPASDEVILRWNGTLVVAEDASTR